MDPQQTFSHYPAIRPPVRVRLHVAHEHPCAYLPGRSTTTRALWADEMAPHIYHRFMDAGFRRSGKVIYQPACSGCRACVPIRVPVVRFAMSKSQRRWWRRNQDLQISVQRPAPDDQRFDLYQRYTAQWHSQHEPADYQQFVAFLYDSPLETIEIVYRDPSGKLIGVGLCDVCEQSLSSVYFYFDPEASERRLGTFSALWEIDLARRLDIPHYYLGYWIDGCASMQYKAQFRPCELLGTDGVWREFGSI